jgi:hypothetical protein
MDYEEAVEDMIFSWIVMLPEEEQHNITHFEAINACLNEEAEEEIREEIWRQLKNNISYASILQRLRSHLDSVVETSDESSSEEVVDSDSE